jgi:hypothetical protein
MTAEKMAALLQESYNNEARKHDWPPQREPRAFLRGTADVKTATEGLAACLATETKRRPEHIVDMIWSSWNWRRSPAPKKLAGSKKLWASLQTKLLREAEETQTTLLEANEMAAFWAQQEFARNANQGLAGEEAAKQTITFAKATGRYQAWSHSEREAVHKKLNQMAENTG